MIRTKDGEGCAKQQKIHIELLRIIAIFLVMFNHLSGYTLYMISDGFKQQFYMILTMITRINVPLFFMISGSLLLPKSENIYTVFKKRIIRYSLIMLIFEFGLFLIQYNTDLLNGKIYTLTVIGYLRSLISGTIDVAFSYWFLYAYLGFLVALPFLQRMVKGMKKDDFILLLAFHFLFSSLLPVINLIFNHFNIAAISINGNFSVVLSTQKYLFYPLVGYYIEHHVNIEHFNLKRISFCSLIAILGISISCICTNYEAITTGKYTQNYVQLFDYITAIAVFIFVKYFIYAFKVSTFQNKFVHCISSLGTLTFGVYLLDPYWKYFFYSSFVQTLNPYFPTLLISLLWCIFSIFIGSITTIILKHLPIFKKIL